MSFILDALERSRRERDANAVPADNRLYGIESPTAHGGFPWLPILLSTALVLSLVALLWLWAAHRIVTPPGEGPAAVEAPVTLLQSAPAPVIPATGPSTAEEGIRASVAAEVEALYRDVRQPVSLPMPAPAPTVDSSPVPVVPDRATEAEVEALVAEAEAALGDRALESHPAPMLAELSQSRRDAIPTLMYLQHDYRGGAGASSVLINRQRCREGDSVSGVEVQEILADSVVLNHRGTVFRLRALNSWVNL